MYIPIVNRFTCSKPQLIHIKKLINNRNMRAIMDYTNENHQDHKLNFKCIFFE